jgi:hypothetical protein
VYLPALKGGFGAVASITVTGAAGPVKLVRAKTDGKPAEGWVVADKYNYPVQAAILKPVLEGLRALHTVAPKTARPKLYSRLELDNPGGSAGSHSIELNDAKGGVIASVVLGRQKPAASPGGAEQQYVRTPDTAQTWLAEPAITLQDGPLAWVDHSILSVDAEQVKHVVITQTGGEKLELSRAKAEDKLAVQNVPAGRKLKEEDPGITIAGGISALELDDVRPAGSLTNPPAAVAQYETFGGLTADLTLTKQDGKTWAVVNVTGADKAAKDAADITARTKGWAYALSDLRASTLMNSLAGLLEAVPEAKKG